MPFLHHNYDPLYQRFKIPKLVTLGCTMICVMYLRLSMNSSRIKISGLLLTLVLWFTTWETLGRLMKLISPQINLYTLFLLERIWNALFADVRALRRIISFKSALKLRLSILFKNYLNMCTVYLWDSSGK